MYSKKFVVTTVYKCNVNLRVLCWAELLVMSAHHHHHHHHVITNDLKVLVYNCHWQFLTFTHQMHLLFSQRCIVRRKWWKARLMLRVLCGLAGDWLWVLCGLAGDWLWVLCGLAGNWLWVLCGLAGDWLWVLSQNCSRSTSFMNGLPVPLCCTVYHLMAVR